jgi:Secretion system C-terminal sorting domain
MRKLVSLFILFSLVTSSYTQTVFNNLYNNGRATTIIATQDGNYVFSSTTNIGFIGISVLTKIDVLGDTIWTKQYSSIILKSIIETNNGSIIIAGNTQDTVVKGAIMKVNNLGDSLWLQEYGSNELNIFFNLKQTANNEIIAVGESVIDLNLSTENASGWVVKTDSLGVQLWEKQLNYTTDNNVFTNVIINTDTTIICGGISIDSISKNGYLVKLKANGDTIWAKRYNNGVRDINSINPTQDNNYIIASSQENNGNEKAYISKIDTSGNILWAKSYARDTNNYKFEVASELPTGNFIVAGNDFDFSQNPIAQRARLMITNNIGDSLWSQQYTSLGGINEDFLTDMKPTSDGGFIFCGHMNLFNSKSWVMKIDSIDCNNFVNGCSTVEIIELEVNNNISIYPNPSNNIVTINYTLTEPIEAKLEIIDAIGRTVASHDFGKQNTGKQKVDVNIGNLANGLYLFNLRIGPEIIIKRVVKN